MLLGFQIVVGLWGPAQAEDAADWFPFDPPPDPFVKSALDLRSLNEAFAGEHGVIAVRGDAFVHSANQEPVRFWAVNGPPAELSGPALATCARRLAKYGVNLVRMHGAVFEKSGGWDPKRVAHVQEAVAALKAEGIYSHLSIYFPLWMTPAADHPWLKGYDGKTHPFAALMFNPEFQEHYRGWWKALLLTPDATGRRLVDEPAIFGVEIQNEDSFFFWTFNPDQIPAAQMEILEAQFGAWLIRKHGSLAAAQAAWGGTTAKRDAFAAGRVGFRPLWNLFSEKTARDRDTAEFLLETQRTFYAGMVAFLRSLGFKGLITASNWATASPEVLGPLERWSYTPGDFIDRHGYFSITHKGENADWSIRNGHVFADRSALRFDPVEPGRPRQFVHPAMEITYAGKPQMISETTWNRPNRYRSEAPLYFAAYGALQGSDALVHFALDGDRWSVKPNFFMQPWTLMAPSQMAQFPAAAFLYRRGLVKPGDVLARIDLNTGDLLNLKGTPLPQDANFDELRLKDVPAGTEVKPGQRMDPLIHFAGRVEVNFTTTPGKVVLKDLQPFVDRGRAQVRSSTRELALDYGIGLLTINAPAAQGASGNLKGGGTLSLGDLILRSELDNGHVLLVSLDGNPIATSTRMLLQVMSEERPTGFATEDAGKGLKKITDIGRDPWQVRKLQGVVEFKTTDRLSIQPLNFNGYPKGDATDGTSLTLAPETLYYLVTRAR
ncbi:MAG: hypothetical protein U1G08_15395 [Verrucomicrobiota bacterium]